MDAHVELIQKKYWARSWLIRHLKGAGVLQADLVKIYSTTIKSAIEYAAAVYHPMISSQQSDALERLQRLTLKVIYGWQTSYSDALEKSGLPTLRDRRESIFQCFTTMTAANTRFQDWFPLHHPYKYDIRNKKKYREKNQELNVFAMRRFLN